MKQPKHIKFRILVSICIKNINKKNLKLISEVSIYIKRIQKVNYCFFFSFKNTPKLINQQFKNEVKIVNWKKKVRYCFFYYKKYPCLKLKNEVKIVN